MREGDRESERDREWRKMVRSIIERKRVRVCEGERVITERWFVSIIERERERKRLTECEKHV